MATDIDKSKRKTRLPIIIASGLTLLVAALGGWVFFEKSVMGMKGNEIGDFFAGFAGSLSFIWIIATIILQKEELELQRAEIAKLAEEANAQSMALTTAAKLNLKTRFSETLQTTQRLYGAELEERYDDYLQYLSEVTAVVTHARSLLREKYSAENCGDYLERFDIEGLIEIYPIAIYCVQARLLSNGMAWEIESYLDNARVQKDPNNTVVPHVHFDWTAFSDVIRPIDFLDQEIGFEAELKDILSDAHRLQVLSIVNSTPYNRNTLERDLGENMLRLLCTDLAARQLKATGKSTD